MTPAPANCHTCELTRRRDAGDCPEWDVIQRTRSWDVVHAYDTAVEGWLVLVLRRHIETIADLTAAEADDLGPLIRQTSRALHEVTGCAKTYVVQFAEHPMHPHVHVHVIPRAPDHPEGRRGPRVFDLLGVPEHERVTDDQMTVIARQLREALAA